MKLKFLKLPAFTLIELLIVIAIVGIMAAAILVAINPAKRSGQARDAIRKSDIAVLADAFQAYYVAHGGLYPGYPGFPINFPLFCGSWAFDELVTSGELKVVPTDPQDPTNQYCVRIKRIPPNSEAAIFAMLEEPTNLNLVFYCWNSRTNTLFETNGNTCVQGI